MSSRIELTEASLYQYSHDYKNESYRVYISEEDIKDPSFAQSQLPPLSYSYKNYKNFRNYKNNNTYNNYNANNYNNNTNYNNNENNYNNNENNNYNNNNNNYNNNYNNKENQNNYNTQQNREQRETGQEPNFNSSGSDASSNYTNYSNYSDYSNNSSNYNYSSENDSGAGGYKEDTTTSGEIPPSSYSSSSSSSSSSNIPLSSSSSSSNVLLSSSSSSSIASKSSTDKSSDSSAPSMRARAGSFSSYASEQKFDNSGDVFQIKTSLANLLNDFSELDLPIRSTPNGGFESESNQNVAPPVAIVRTRNWNEEFQELLDLRALVEKNSNTSNLEESIDVYERLSNLEKDFVYTATLYGRIIIAEQFQVTKTIIPANVGGVAGGTKYIVNGILFKFVKEDTQLHLYGSDECAMKTASHERNGLVSFHHCGIKDLRTPLMAYIDYKGYRLMALSILPINKKTLIYGSNDGGTDVHMDDPRFNDLMQLAAQRLNLKQHTVGASKNGMGGKQIYGPADIEGHLGLDGRYYLLDFARLAPPEPVTNASAPGAFLYQHLRLELVKKSDVPLSSDAFSYIGRIDGPLHNAEVRRAFKTLKDDIIPKFAKSIHDDPKSLDDMEEFIYNLHSQGINVRLLGVLSTHCTDEKIQKRILLEAVSRVIKNQFRFMLREEMKASGASTNPYRKLVVNLLNLIFGGVDMNFTSLYWNDVIKNDLESKFRNISFKHSDLYDVCVREQGSSLLTRLSKVCGIVFKKQALKTMADNMAEFRFVDPDLKDLDCVVTRLNMIDYSDGMALYYKAKTLTKQEKKDSQLRLLTMSRDRLRAARYSMCSTEEAIYYSATVEQFVAKLQRDEAPAVREEALKSAEKSFDELLNMNTFIKHDILISKAKCIRSRAKLKGESNKMTESLAIYEEAFKNLNFAHQIEPSDISLYLMAKVLVAKTEITNKFEELLEAERLMTNAHEKQPMSPIYSYGLALILLQKHKPLLKPLFNRSIQTGLPIYTIDTPEQCEERQKLLKQIGLLMETALQANPKYYTTKLTARLNKAWFHEVYSIWGGWGWARYAPTLTDSVRAAVSNITSLEMNSMKYIDSSLNKLLKVMPKITQLDLNNSVDDKSGPISHELAMDIITPPIANHLTYLGLAKSNVRQELFGSPRKFSNLVELDLTSCKYVDIINLDLPNLKSIKLSGCDSVPEDSLTTLSLKHPLLETLHLPDHIMPAAMETICSKLPELKSFKAPKTASESSLKSVLSSLNKLEKLDLIGCSSISFGFVDSINKLCKYITKARDAKGIPHIFTGGYTNNVVNITSEAYGHVRVMQFSWPVLSLPEIKIEKDSVMHTSLPKTWRAKVSKHHSAVKFRNAEIKGFLDLAQISRTEQFTNLTFSFANSATKVEIQSGAVSFPNKNFLLFGHNVRLTGSCQPNQADISISEDNKEVARVKGGFQGNYSINLYSPSLNINMLVAIIVMIANKDLK